MRRIQLVNSLIVGLLFYSFHVYKWHIKLLLEVEQPIWNFVWIKDEKKIRTIQY